MENNLITNVRNEKEEVVNDFINAINHKIDVSEPISISTEMYLEKDDDDCAMQVETFSVIADMDVNKEKKIIELYHKRDMGITRINYDKVNVVYNGIEDAVSYAFEGKNNCIAFTFPLDRKERKRTLLRL